MFPAALSSRPWESEICAHTHHLIGWLGGNGSLGGDVSLYLCITLDHFLAIQRALHLRFVGVECVRVCASVCVQWGMFGVLRVLWVVRAVVSVALLTKVVSIALMAKGLLSFGGGSSV